MEEVQAWHVMASAAAESRRSTSKSLLRLRMYLLMLLGDVIAISAGFLIAGQIHVLHHGNGQWMDQLIMLLPLYVATALLIRAYSPAIVHERWTSMGRGINALALATSTIMLVAFFLKASDGWSRATFFAGVMMSGFFLMVVRYAFVRHSSALVGGEPYEIVVVCDGVPAPSMPSANCTIVMESSDVFDPSRLSPAIYDRFAEVIQYADRVIVQCPPERRQVWALTLKGANVQGEVIAPEMSELSPIGIARHNGVPTLIVSRGPLGLKDRIIKRLFDITVAGAVLFLLAPLLVLVALAIYLQDRGPVFFVQTRVGRSNRLFHILKFRSMHVASSDAKGTLSASRNDNRVTPFGRFIRATSIDEMPQLINVLKGDMSIVGPRPHALGSRAENLLFWHIDERYWHRHAIKPGLTGLAQVRGYRGATERKADLVNRLQSDLEYLHNWTLWRDIVILIRTVSVVLHQNAY